MLRRSFISVQGLVLTVLLGILLGAGGFTFYFARGMSYLSNDPAACVNCHIMREQYDGWLKSGHHAVATCNDCHVPQPFLAKYATKARSGYVHSRGFTLNDFPEPIRVHPANLAVVEDNCVRCHQDLTGQMLAHVGETEIHCVHCHGDVGHGPTR